MMMRMGTYYGYGLNPALVGHVVSGVDLSADKEVLTIRLADGTEARYRAEGDCCSQTWIEHITIPPDIDGATITGVSEDDGRPATPEEEDKTRKDHDYVDVLVVYQSSFQTDRGEVIIEYRNDSNGYYGGSLRQIGGLE